MLRRLFSSIESENYSYVFLNNGSKNKKELSYCALNQFMLVKTEIINILKNNVSIKIALRGYFEKSPTVLRSVRGMPSDF